MPDPTSVVQIDLTPPLGKRYFSIEREWREEFVYFTCSRLNRRLEPILNADSQPEACKAFIKSQASEGWARRWAAGAGVAIVYAT